MRHSMTRSRQHSRSRSPLRRRLSMARSRSRSPQYNHRSRVHSRSHSPLHHPPSRSPLRSQLSANDRGAAQSRPSSPVRNNETNKTHPQLPLGQQHTRTSGSWARSLSHEGVAPTPSGSPHHSQATESFSRLSPPYTQRDPGRSHSQTPHSQRNMTHHRSTSQPFLSSDTQEPNSGGRSRYSRSPLNTNLNQDQESSGHHSSRPASKPHLRSRSRSLSESPISGSSKRARSSYSGEPSHQAKIQKLDTGSRRAKAADFDNASQELIKLANSRYRALIAGSNAFPDSAQELGFLQSAWNYVNTTVGLSQGFAAIMTPDVSSIVCIIFS